MCRGTKKLGRSVCRAGCKGAKGLLRSLSKTLDSAKSFLQGMQKIATGFLKLIETIIRNLHIDIRMRGHLDLKSAQFNTDFHVRAGKASWKWQIKVDVKFEQIQKFVELILNRINKLIGAKIPGIQSLIKF